MKCLAQVVQQLNPAWNQSAVPMTPDMLARERYEMLLMLGAWWIISAVKCLILYRLQKSVPPQHRRIQPPMVWLLMIPGFHLYWNFKVFREIAESYQRACAGGVGNQSTRAELRAGDGFCICAVLSYLPLIFILAVPTSWAFFIAFSVKLFRLKVALDQRRIRGFR